LIFIPKKKVPSLVLLFIPCFTDAPVSEQQAKGILNPNAIDRVLLERKLYPVKEVDVE